MKSTKLGLIIIVTLAFVSGCSMNSADYDKGTIEKAEAMTKSYLNNNYNNIKTIEIEDVYKGEMGGLRVKGTVNKKYEFGVGVNESDFTMGSIGVEKGFPEKKEECKKKICDY